MDDASEKLLEVMREMLAEVKLFRAEAAQSRTIAEALTVNSALLFATAQQCGHEGLPHDCKSFLLRNASRRRILERVTEKAYLE